MIVNQQSGTRIDEVAAGIYRISTPIGVDAIPGGFSFNQYLLLDERPMLFHTGPRSMEPLVQEAISAVLPVARLRYIGFSHHENDENGALEALLDAAPAAVPVCGSINAMINAEVFGRPPRGLADGEVLTIGKKRLRWVDTPHMPHGWETGLLYEETTRTLLCADVFTQPGADNVPLSESGSRILESSEAMRAGMDYFAHAPWTVSTLERLAALEPETLACMHGSAFRGDCAGLLRELAARLAAGK